MKTAQSEPNFAELEKIMLEVWRLYTTPPKREWVGLTCIDYGLICREADDIASALLMAEAKLKEKNT